MTWHNNIVFSNSSLRSSNAGLVLRIEIVRAECFKRSFFNRIVTLWNALPRQLRDADSLYCLKRKLVMHYETLLQFSIRIMYAPAQGHVGVTPVCVIVVLHVKTLLLLILLPF